MALKCCCLNNTPVRIPDDDKKGERYECYYCKFKWRFIEVSTTFCSFCNDHINKEICGWCTTKNTYTSKKTLVYW